MAFQAWGIKEPLHSPMACVAPHRTLEGSLMGCSKWYHFGTPIPRPPLACHGPLSVCFAHIGLPKGWQMEVEKGFKMSLKRGSS